MRKTSIIAATLLLMVAPAFAGMTSPGLSDVAGARIDAISFFLFIYLVCAVIFRWLWNLLAKDFAWMPRLTLGRSIALLVVVGLFLYFVLTMISGARELMTPGAWAKDGISYRLNTPDRQPKPWLDAARERWLERLRTALWDYASKHEGNLPAHPFVSDFDEGLWKGVDPEGQWLSYNPGLKLTGPPQVLVYEPPPYGPRRWALLTDGTILLLNADELDARVKKEWLP